MSALSTAEILDRLPHRHPFIGLDRIEQLESGSFGIAIKNISIADPVFQGHFPQEPIYPGVLVLEAAAQLAGIVLSPDADPQEESSNGQGPRPPLIGYLASVKRFKWMRVVRPGDQLVITATAGVRIGGMCEFAIEVKVDGHPVAAGSLAVAQGGETP
jgi:3-hydroxyacyl-[acyl-carrier-protein] dehydratase